MDAGAQVLGLSSAAFASTFLRMLSFLCAYYCLNILFPQTFLHHLEKLWSFLIILNPRIGFLWSLSLISILTKSSIPRCVQIVPLWVPHPQHCPTSCPAKTTSSPLCHSASAVGWSWSKAEQKPIVKTALQLCIQCGQDDVLLFICWILYWTCDYKVNRSYVFCKH